jgi:Protein of unknown function (DUF3037)
VRDCYAYDYAVLRLVPQVEREEFINVGVILSCPERQFLATRISLDGARLKLFAPTLDEAVVRSHLASFEAVCRGGIDGGPIGALPARQRFHWLVAPRSTIIQTSPAHTGWCRDPEETLDRLLRQYVLLDA